MADYRNAQLNAQNFHKWLQEKLIPDLNEPSVIVMDNASYHCIQINKAPTTQNLKSEIKAWLQSNDIPFEDYHTKAELLCLVNKNKPNKIGDYIFSEKSEIFTGRTIEKLIKLREMLTSMKNWC